MGVLMTVAADSAEAPARLTAFVQGLQQSGWTDGRNVRIDVRWGVSDPDRSRRYAAELVALAPGRARAALRFRTIQVYPKDLADSSVAG
jgi:putative ABC transport system substrate-binding protein